MRWSVNPFAIAELIEGAPPDRNDEQALGGFLTKAYQVGDLAALFDHDGGEPARMDLFRSLAQAVRDPQRLDDVLALPIAQRLAGLYGKDAVARVLPFIVPVANAVLAPDAGDGRYRVGDWGPVADVVVDQASWRDPVQGAIADCYLVAAMIAVAWALPAGWRARIDAARKPDGAFEFAFYRGTHGFDPGTRVALRLPRNANGRPLFARSSQPDEAWPGLLEKAFVSRVRRLRAEPEPADYVAIGDERMEPKLAARMLAGGHANTLVNVTAGKRLSTQLQALCDERGVTRLPVIACTSDTRDDTDGLGWRQTGLFHGHAYAVLGTLREDGRDYVALRNPYGSSLFRPEGSAIGPWTPGPGVHGDPQVTLNTNGVAAIARDWFDRSMRELDWLEPASRGRE